MTRLLFSICGARSSLLVANAGGLSHPSDCALSRQIVWVANQQPWRRRRQVFSRLRTPAAEPQGGRSHNAVFNVRPSPRRREPVGHSALCALAHQLDPLLHDHGRFDRQELACHESWAHSGCRNRKRAVEPCSPLRACLSRDPRRGSIHHWQLGRPGDRKRGDGANGGRHRSLRRQRRRAPPYESRNRNAV